MPTEAGFAGFPSEAVTFFKQLEANNRREWFQERKHIYEEAVKAPLCALVEALNRSLFRVAPDYVTDPKDAVYRIYRDTRFSADKTPYKTHAAALFKKRGLAKNAGAGLYFSISHKEIEVASGIYMPSPEELLAVRTHIAAKHEEFRRLLKSKKLRDTVGELKGEQLSRVPKGFCAEHPAADLLRYKQFLLWRMLDPKIVTTPDLFKELAAALKAMVPFIEFLNAPIASKRRDPVLA